MMLPGMVEKFCYPAATTRFFVRQDRFGHFLSKPGRLRVSGFVCD
jgi:hypothetical protein